MKHPSSSLVKKDLLFAALRHEETPRDPLGSFRRCARRFVERLSCPAIFDRREKTGRRLIGRQPAVRPGRPAGGFRPADRGGNPGMRTGLGGKSDAPPSPCIPWRRAWNYRPACRKKPMAGCKIRWIGNKSKNGWRYWLPMKALCRSKRWISITTAMPRVKRILPGWIANLASRSNLCRIGSP